MKRTATLLGLLAIAACTRNGALVATLQVEGHHGLRLDGLVLRIEVGDRAASTPIDADGTARLTLTDIPNGAHTVYARIYHSSDDSVVLLLGAMDVTVDGQTELEFSPGDFSSDDRDSDGISSWTEYNYGCDPTSGSPPCEWIDVAAGESHTCALDTSHNIYCWGNNDHGQRAEGIAGTYDDRVVPFGAVTNPSGNPWVELTAGANHNCAIDAEARLYCWGNNEHGQVDDSFDTEFSALPEVTEALGWLHVSAGHGHTCAVRVNGELWCWGRNQYGQADPTGDGSNVRTPTPINTWTDWTAVSAGEGHTCGLRGASLYCWGTNEHNQINGGAPDVGRYEPVAIDGAWRSVSAGAAHTCAVNREDTLFCWGANWSWQAGDARDTSTVTEPFELPVGRIVMASAGSEHSCAVAMNGSLYCWGLTEQGRLGIAGLDQHVHDPTVIGTSTSWVRVSAGDTHACGIDRGVLYCWGSHFHGKTGLGQRAYEPAPVELPYTNQWSAVSAGFAHTCALDNTYNVYCWGSNNNGQLGIGHFGDRDEPVLVGANADSWRVVEAGELHTCGVAGGHAYCWGNDDYGQLGDGSTTTDLQAEPVRVVRPSSGFNWFAVSAGQSHTCGLLQDSGGDLMYCWGNYEDGALGAAGLYENQRAPGPVVAGGIDDWTDVSVGAVHTCGVNEAGSVYCWGTNDHGQVGTASASGTPQQILSGGYSYVSAGALHTCAVSPNVALSCWGENEDGRIGDGTSGNTVLTPAQLTSTDFSRVAAGSYHTCGLGVGGQVRCWGANEGHQLGITGSPGETTPQDLDGLTAGGISAGDLHTCAISSNVLYCWGSNEHGQLGTGNAWAETPDEVRHPARP